jgi:hypothetical protein
MASDRENASQQPPKMVTDPSTGDPTLVKSPSSSGVVEEQAQSMAPDPSLQLTETQQKDQEQFETVKNNCYCDHQDQEKKSNEGNADESMASTTKEDLVDCVKHPNIICFTCKSEFHKGNTIILCNIHYPLW